MTRYLPALALCCASAHAAPAAVIQTSAGSVELHAEAGECIGQARRAEWVSADAQTRIPGCWVTDGRIVQIAWRDGDVTRAPVAAAKRPEVL